MENGDQIVAATIEGNDDQVAAYTKSVKSNTLGRAIVSSIVSMAHDGEVMRVGEYAMICSAVQLNKAIPLLLEIKDNTSPIPQMQKDVKCLLEGQNTLLEKQNILLDKQDTQIAGQKTHIGAQKEMANEFRGLHEDMIRRSDNRLSRIEKDIRLMKNKVGIR